MCIEKKPHIHAESIKAWADGAEIQVRDTHTEWLDTSSPFWCLTSQYRIKPVPERTLAEVYLDESYYPNYPRGSIKAYSPSTLAQVNRCINAVIEVLVKQGWRKG